jgi:hypothetical protein
VPVSRRTYFRESLIEGAELNEDMLTENIDV